MDAIQKLQYADIFLILLYPFAMLRHTRPLSKLSRPKV